MSLEKELSLDKPFTDVRHEAVLNIVRTANLLAATADNLFRKHGLTEAQFNVLFLLNIKRHPVTQSELGKRLVVTRASITSVLDKLEAKGLVVRKSVPGNRRIYHIDLTSKGRELVARVEPLYRSGIHRATAALDDKDCKALIGFLEDIRAKAETALG
ncbi:MAG TPA: MarR family transcriptional regulator [Candidatus Hydrogenedentes bacterium]|nr:MarR family transcriptional regulator [Candidatus Hydrogenedentota bacterium]HPG69534.1 MarR family transcriptional regulator [Candidatus Hydrogenedentota bacterium]